ncbi:hypothetical protein [Candidatus Phycorickettsia trachydisci]|nr:hypothetical protein [Candidatus Phycorickettsia trachydisci]
MRKSTQPSMPQIGFKLYSEAISKFEGHYPIVIEALHILLVHSIHTPKYFKTVVAIYNFIGTKVGEESQIPREIKILIVRKMQEAFLQAAYEICFLINEKDTGLGINVDKFKPLFKFLTNKVEEGKFLDVQFWVSPRCFIERLNPQTKNKYVHECAKRDKEKGSIKYVTDIDVWYSCYENLANLVYLLLNEQPISDQDVRKIFDIPKILSTFDLDTQPTVQRMALKNAMNFYGLVDARKEFKVFTDILNQSSYTADYPLLLEAKIGLLTNHIKEMDLLTYCKSHELKVMKELVIDIKDTIAKIPLDRRSPEAITFAIKRSQELLERYSGLNSPEYLEVKLVSLQIANKKILSPQDVLELSMHLVEDLGIMPLNKSLLKECLELLKPYLLFPVSTKPNISKVLIYAPQDFDESWLTKHYNDLLSRGLESSEAAELSRWFESRQMISTHEEESRMCQFETGDLLKWLISNHKIESINEEELFREYQESTKQILGSLPKDSLLTLMIERRFFESKVKYYAFNNNIVEVRALLDHMPSGTDANAFKINLLYSILQNELSHINPEFYFVFDSINFTENDYINRDVHFQGSILAVYNELLLKTIDSDKAVEIFDKASDILLNLNKNHLKGLILLHKDKSPLLSSNQFMVIAAIKYDRDYRDYISALAKAANILQDKAFNAEIRQFRELINDIEENKDQIDFNSLISRAGSIRSTSQLLRDEYKKQIPDPIKPQQETSIVIPPSVELEEKPSASSQVQQLPDEIVIETKQYEIIPPQSVTSQTPLKVQPVFVAQVDQHDIALKNKSSEIARKIHQIFQKNREHANEQIYHKIIPSWFIDGHKYTSASFEVVEVWDNIYAIISPKLLSRMDSVTFDLCQNAFHKGYAARFKGASGFKLLEKLVWELKCQAKVRWAVKSLNIDLLTKAVLLIVDHQTNHDGIEDLLSLKRTGKVKDKITYSNTKDTKEEIKEIDHENLGYDMDIEAFLKGESTESYEMQDVI